MKPTNNRIYCIGCRHTKILFESEAKAVNFIKFNKEEIALNSKKVPQRAYYCSFCCGWHVTSVSEKGKIELLEARDKRKWERIKSAGNKETYPTQGAFQFLSFMEAKEEYKHLYRLIETLLKNINYAESDIRNMDMEKAEMHCRFALKYLDDAIIFASNNKLYFGRKHDFERKLKILLESFEIIRQHDVNHVTRDTYICLPSVMVNPYARIFLKNKDFTEETDRKLSELETLVKYGVIIRAKGLIDDIELGINDHPSECYGKTVGKKRKQFKRRLASVMTKAGIYEGMDCIKDETVAKYLTVIDILEKAHTAYAKKDLKSLRIMIKVAEGLIPAEKNEIGDTLRVQIQTMKNVLIHNNWIIP